MSYLTTERKQKIFTDFGGNAKNTGSVQGQIALFTDRIKEISDHLQKGNKKDHASRRALLKMVGKRKRLLQYLAKKDIESYRALIQKLNIRK